MKITSLQLNGHRGFESYGLNDLARVNLLVGKNNSGKTSVLEAISLLAENGSLPALARSAIQRRQQKFWYTDSQRNIDIFDISAVFFGYSLSPNTRFTVASNLNRMSMEMVPSATLRKVSSASLLKLIPYFLPGGTAMSADRMDSGWFTQPLGIFGVPS